MSEVKHIVVTGFSGTGSSAVIDLLKELDGSGVTFSKKDYEDYFLTAPGALFDLEWKLLNNNDPHRSDEAIREFLKVMTKLYQNDFNWFGGYKKNIGPSFMKNVYQFVDALSEQSNTTWYYRYQYRRFSLVRFLYRLFRYKLFDHSFHLDGVHVGLDKTPIYISYPSSEEFFFLARKFIKHYLKMISEGDINIHDHLIWPSHVKNICNYFDDSFRFIIVHRDARDVFLTNKYLYSKHDATGTYPTEATAFVDYWGRLLKMGENQFNENVIHINFEDLIYQYKEESQKIFNFCKIDSKKWIKKRFFFNPDKSIKNTQLFLMNDVCKEEGKVIEHALPHLIYSYPYTIQTSLKDMFI
ncbi:hypothetical protein D3Z58_10685 [Clostridiaceae bacterium]|nr:hypothetical protein [Clostridiaceae bacterium]